MRRSRESRPLLVSAASVEEPLRLKGTCCSTALSGQHGSGPFIIIKSQYRKSYFFRVLRHEALTTFLTTSRDRIPVADRSILAAHRDLWFASEQRKPSIFPRSRLQTQYTSFQDQNLKATSKYYSETRDYDMFLLWSMLTKLRYIRAIFQCTPRSSVKSSIIRSFFRDRYVLFRSSACKCD